MLTMRIMDICVPVSYKIMQMGQSLEAFVQWKTLVSLLLGCTESVSAHKPLNSSKVFVWNANCDPDWVILCSYECFFWSCVSVPNTVGMRPSCVIIEK